MLTGQQGRGIPLTAVEFGTYDFCAKPFELDVLSMMIERALRTHELQ